MANIKEMFTKYRDYLDTDQNTREVNINRQS